MVPKRAPAPAQTAAMMAANEVLIGIPKADSIRLSGIPNSDFEKTGGSVTYGLDPVEYNKHDSG